MRRYKSRIRCFYLYRLASIHLMTEVTSILGLNCKRDVIKETHDFLDSRKIGIETMMQAFSFFSGMTQDEKNQMMKAYKNGEFDGHKDQNS